MPHCQTLVAVITVSLALFIRSADAQATRRPRADDNPCRGQPDGSYQKHPLGCAYFFICIKGQVNTSKCPKNLAYNPENPPCDLASVVGCVLDAVTVTPRPRRTTTTTSRPTTTSTTTTTTLPPTTTTTTTTTTPAPTTTTTTTTTPAPTTTTTTTTTTPLPTTTTTTTTTTPIPTRTTSEIRTTLTSMLPPTFFTPPTPPPTESTSTTTSEATTLLPEIPSTLPAVTIITPVTELPTQPAVIPWIPSTTPTAMPATFETIVASTVSTLATTAVPNGSPTTALPIESGLITCPAVEDESAVRFVSSNEDCARYYICYHNQPLRMQCAAGLHWNHRSKQCDLRERAACAIQSPQATAFPVCPRDAGARLFGHPERCDQFLYCAHGEMTLQQCPLFYHFDIELKRCELRTLAKCGVPQNAEREDEESGGGRPQVPEYEYGGESVIIE